MTILLKKSKKDKAESRFRRMTLDEVKSLSSGSCQFFLAVDGLARTIKINGRIHTWRRDPARVEVPVKYGMYEYETFNAEEATRRFLIEIV